jgi:hypothetical protein
MALQTNMFPQQQLNYNNGSGVFCAVCAEVLQAWQV